MNGLLTIALIASVTTNFVPPKDGKSDDVSDAEKSVFELVKRLDLNPDRRFLLTDPDCKIKNDVEAGLQEIVRHGKNAEKALLFVKLKRDAFRLADLQNPLHWSWNRNRNSWKEFTDADRLGENLEILTALRRAQQNPDPLSIRVVLPNGTTINTWKLPSFSVTLRSEDVERTPVWVQLIPNFWGTHREAQWRFEVRTAEGKLLQVRSHTGAYRRLTGSPHCDWLPFGETLDTVLPMSDFVDIPNAGEYTVTLLYHAKIPISDITNPEELDDLIVFRSQPFQLTVTEAPKLVIESSKAERATVLSLITALPNRGFVKIVVGTYGRADHAFVSPKSPAGKILNMNWQAVPALLDSLPDSTVSPHRKAWVLSLLYTIARERDLHPFELSGAFPSYDAREDGNTISWTWGGEIIPQEQESAIAKWLKFGETCLDIRSD